MGNYVPRLSKLESQVCVIFGDRQSEMPEFIFVAASVQRLVLLVLLYAP
jgi:hypothetical protein